MSLEGLTWSEMVDHYCSNILSGPRLQWCRDLRLRDLPVDLRNVISKNRPAVSPRKPTDKNYSTGSLRRARVMSEGRTRGEIWHVPPQLHKIAQSSNRQITCTGVTCTFPCTRRAHIPCKQSLQSTDNTSNQWKINQSILPKKNNENK